MTTGHARYRPLTEILAPYISRGSVLQIPPGVEGCYTDETQALIEELRHLDRERREARSQVRQLGETLQAVPLEHQRAAAQAARDGTELPADPTAGLEAQRDEAGRQIDALEGAMRSVSRELIAALETEAAEASAVALKAAQPAIASAIKAAHEAVATAEAAEHQYALSRWAASPNGIGSLETLGTVIKDLRRAGRQLERVAPGA